MRIGRLTRASALGGVGQAPCFAMGTGRTRFLALCGVLLAGLLAAGCGDGEEQGEVTRAGAIPNESKLQEVTSCLDRAGLRYSRPLDPPPQSTVLKVPLKSGNYALFYVYRSTAAAVEGAKTIKAFLAGGGGSATVKGEVVLGYARPVSAREAEPVQACA